MRISDWSSDVCSSDLDGQKGYVTHGSGSFAAFPAEVNGDARRPLPPAANQPPRIGKTARSEERRVGKECVSTCRSRSSAEHSKKKSMNLQKKQGTLSHHQYLQPKYNKSYP